MTRPLLSLLALGLLVSSLGAQVKPACVIVNKALDKDHPRSWSCHVPESCTPLVGACACGVSYDKNECPHFSFGCRSKFGSIEGCHDYEYEYRGTTKAWEPVVRWEEPTLGLQQPEREGVKAEPQKPSNSRVMPFRDYYLTLSLEEWIEWQHLVWCVEKSNTKLAEGCDPRILNLQASEAEPQKPVTPAKCYHLSAKGIETEIPCDPEFLKLGEVVPEKPVTPAPFEGTMVYGTTGASDVAPVAGIDAKPQPRIDTPGILCVGKDCMEEKGHEAIIDWIFNADNDELYIHQIEREKAELLQTISDQQKVITRLEKQQRSHSASTSGKK